MDNLHVSVSQLKTFLRCPRLFELRYVVGAAPEFLPVPLAFGSAIHSGLAAYYGGLKLFGTVPSLQEVVQAFRDAWDKATSGPTPLQAEDDEGTTSHVDKGVEMLTVFHAHAVSSGTLAVDSVERPFTMSLHHPDTGEVLDEHLTGFMDLVVEEDGRKVIVEHKSSSKKYAIDQLRWDFQLTGYQLAAREAGLGEVGLRFQVLTKTKKPAVQIEDVRRDAQDEEDFLRVAVGVLKAIDGGVSYPVRGYHCRSCPHQAACSSRRSFP